MVSLVLYRNQMLKFILNPFGKTMKRKITSKVALLDVDETLIFADYNNSNRSVVNDELLNRLKQAGVTNIYLFTDMTFKPTNLQDREWLITKLKARGFTISGVVCPADVVWNLEKETLSKIEESINTAFSDKNMRHMSDKDRHQANKPIFTDTIEQTILSAASNYTMGSAYQEAAAEFHTTISDNADLSNPCLLENHTPTESLQAMRTKSEQCKHIADAYADAQFVGCGVKGMMYRVLTSHLANDGVKEIFFADDKETELNSAKKIHTEQFAESGLRLTNIHITKNNRSGRVAGYDSLQALTVSKPLMIAGSVLTGVGGAAAVASLSVLTFAAPLASQAISTLNIAWPIALAMLGLGVVGLGIYTGIRCHRSRFFQKETKLKSNPPAEDLTSS